MQANPQIAEAERRAVAPEAKTLTEVLWLRARYGASATHLHLWEDDEQATTITHGELLQGAAAVARGLAFHGVGRGDAVAIMLPTGAEFFFTFFGTLLAGAVPVPIYPPFRADKIEEYAERQTAILANAEARLLVTFRQAERLAWLLKPRVRSLAGVVTAEQLARTFSFPPSLDTGTTDERADFARADDIALIQYTSGSTGNPRGIVLTHANLLANLRAIGEGVAVRADDVTICWLPLYHDMGLIGCWLFSLYFGLPIVALSPVAFLRRPERWLWAFHRYRGTLSPAPNFAYELCARKVPEAALAGLDLSSWRVALNGAEPISVETLARFTERYARYGFRAEAMMPVYGLAECTVALNFAPVGRPPRIDRIQRTFFQEQRRAEPAAASEADALRFVSVGRALPEHEVRIVDDTDRPLGERVEGHVQFRGPSAMQGYHRDPDATAAVRTADGWHRTGDLGYLAEDELFITGRTKDLIIKAGRNLYPQEIEEIAAEVEGVRRGCVAAFAVPEPKTGSEALVLVAETRESDDAVCRRITAEIMRRVGQTAGVPPDHIRLVPPQTIPKTPSGKLRRGACRELFLADALVPPRLPAWLQVARLAAGSTVATLKQAMSRVAPAPLRQWLAPSPLDKR